MPVSEPSSVNHDLFIGDPDVSAEDASAWDTGLTTEVLLARVVDSLRTERDGDELVIRVRTYAS